MLNQIEKDIILISIYSVKRDYSSLKKYLAELKIKKNESVKIYEAILQSYLLAGFPSALVSLKILSEFFEPPNFEKNISDKTDYYNSGIKNLQKVYGDKTDKLLKNIKTFSHEMSFWLVEEGYGKVFSRKTLSIRERELGFCSILIVLKYKDQLISHFLGALRNKVTEPEINEMIELLKENNLKTEAKFGKKIFNDIIKK